MKEEEHDSPLQELSGSPQLLTSEGVKQVQNKSYSSLEALGISVALL